jgi:uncharacterized protein (TIGR01319 family)
VTTCGGEEWSLTSYLLADVGSTFTKLCLVGTSPPALVATAAAPTTIATDINEGFAAAQAKLGRLPGGDLETLVCSSAAGGLRIAAVGLVPELTMKAATLAALGAGGTVVGGFSFRLNRGDLERLRDLRPDLVLLAGGTDGGDTEHILGNARLLAEGLPDTPLVVAGNRDANDALKDLLGARDDVSFAENVMPDLRSLNLQPARECIRKVFLERITVAKGLARLKSRARVLMPTPEAVLRAVALLSRGHGSGSGLGELLAVDIGGATTDVYSCAEGKPESQLVVPRGVPEPFEKRTVEADIGMRYTLRFLVEKLDLDGLGRTAGLDPSAFRAWVETVGAHPEVLPSNSTEARMDTVLATAACAIATERHCGRLEEAFTPEGRVFLQEGKDLGRVGWVVGTGGPMTNSSEPATILASAVRLPGSLSLKPRNPEFLLDRRYILWAMGLLTETEPAVALVLMNEHLERVG